MTTVETGDKNTGRIFIKGLRIALVLIIAGAIAAVLIKIRPHPTRRTVVNPVSLVETIKAHKTSQNMIIRAYGTVRSGENLSLTAEVRGRIVEMSPDFEEGICFPKGAFLMRIDPSSYSLKVDRLRTEIKRLDAEVVRISQERKNLQASLIIVEEDLGLVKAEYERNLALAKRKVVSQNLLDQTQQRWLTSRQKAQEIENSLALIKPRINLLKAQRQSVLVQMKEAQLDLERTEIRAPFECRMAKKLVETGQYVTAGMKLAHLYNVGIMEVEVHIPPQDIVWLHFNSGGSVNLKGDPPARARVTFNAGGQKIHWQGFVSRTKGQMPVIIEVKDGHPGTGHPLMPGMFVTVEIVGKRVDDLYLLPREAVHEDNSVYVVDDGKVHIKSVKIFRRVDNELYVKEGIEEGDQIITRFPGVATEGMKVRIKPKPDQTGESG
jgi:multidrug efflux pump subunit AcrA (membrane-fusion protein)